jgi:large repetitive protein
LAVLINALSSPQDAQASSHILTDANSSVTIVPSSPFLMTDWSVDGEDQLYRQGFWYRTGTMNPEKSIDTIFSSAVQISPSILNTIYTVCSFSIEITYSLLGGASGSGSSAIGENIKITNLTADPLDFHFFQYVDFDLGGTIGDTVWLEKAFNGMFEKAYQKKGNAFFADEIVSPAANHGEVGLSQSILSKLDDSCASTLDDSVGPVTGDAVWGFQWDVLIAGYDSFSIDINKRVHVTPVPEPSTVALISIGAVLLGAARRRLGLRK